MSAPESQVEKEVIQAVEEVVVKVEELAPKTEEKVEVKVDDKISFFARLSHFFTQFSCTTEKALDKTVAPVSLEKPVVAEEKVEGKSAAEEKETDSKVVVDLASKKKVEEDVQTTCIIA